MFVFFCSNIDNCFDKILELECNGIIAGELHVRILFKNNETYIINKSEQNTKNLVLLPDYNSGLISTNPNKKQ